VAFCADGVDAAPSISAAPARQANAVEYRLILIAEIL
jgi:hypothetical protein